MKAVTVCIVLLLIGWVGVVAYRTLGPKFGPSASFAATANPSSSSGPDTSALAPAPDPNVFNLELRPPRTQQGPGDNHLFLAQGVVRPGAHETRSFVLPDLARLTVQLLGEGTRYAFRSPRGAMIVPGDTKDRAGYEYFGAAQGFSGFALEHPEQGTWTVTVEATGSGGPKAYAIDARSDGPAKESAHLETMTRDSDPRLNFLAKPGEPIFIRTFVVQDGRPEPGVSWEIHALTPGGRLVRIPVCDDGHHADGRANDGVFVGAIAAEGPDGFYEVRAAGHAPSGADYVVPGNIEVQAENDLLIADTILVSPASPKAGQPMMLTVTTKNSGTVDSQGVELEFFLGDYKISGQKFDLKAGESKRVTTTWTPPAAGNYNLMLSINPFLEPYASNFANNTQKKVVTVR